jgi:membrane protein insertase Oxa1/YidC/SpoIIIJ
VDRYFSILVFGTGSCVIDSRHHSITHGYGVLLKLFQIVFRFRIFSNIFLGLEKVLISFFLNNLLAEYFIAVAMTGLDQNMMQKNLSCKSLGEAQKNIFWFSIVMVIVNVFFLSLGVLLLYMYYNEYGGTALPTNMQKQGKVYNRSSVSKP